MKKQIILFLLGISGILFGQTSNQVIVTFDHKVGSENLNIGNTVFPIWNGKKLMLSRAEFYISEIAIHNPDGSQTQLNDQYILVNANSPGGEVNLGSWNVSDAVGITLHIGVPASVNHSDPSAWPVEHPLSPKFPTMHWGWTAGYRFLVVEGNADSDNDGTPETAMEYHNVGDEFYKQVDLNGIAKAENGKLYIHLIVDYARLFDSMSLKGSLIWHGNAAPNIDMMNNAAKDGFITMATVTSTEDSKSLSEKIQVSPNPCDASTTLHYSLPGYENLHFMLVNPMGSTVQKMESIAQSGSLDVNTSQLQAGYYDCIFMSGSNAVAHKKLIVVH